MSSDFSNAGRMKAQASGAGSFLTFDDVQEEMVEALRGWRRMPDRERSWLRSRSHWPEIFRHRAFGDYADEEQPEPKPLPLTRAQIARLHEVGEWLRFAPEADRQLIALALAQLAAGRKRVSWTHVRRKMNAEVGTRALGQRFTRGLAKIVEAVNAAENQGERLSSPRKSAE
jgi:hypothetical protein